MEKWTYDDIVDLLKQDYCLHYRNREKFLRNDDEVDADYETAQCDYIIHTLSTITGKSLNEVAEEIDELLEGVFLFDPQDNPKLLAYYKGHSFYAAQDIYYDTYDEMADNIGSDSLNEMLDDFLGLNEATNEVYIPKGTKMTYIGDGVSGWPTFEIHGEQFDFAGDAFKLKPADR